MNLKYLPQELAAEYGYRQQYDPLYIAQQQALQQQYGPTQYAQQLQALQQLDPTGVAVRNALGGDVAQYLKQGYLNPQQAAAYSQFGDLASKAAAQGGWTPEQAAAYKALGQSVTSGVLQGTQIDPTTLNEMSQAIRSRQGPYAQGNAQDMAEAVYIGQRAQQLNQQRQGAAQGYLGLQNPAGQAAQGLQQFAQMQTPQAQSLAAGFGYMGSPNPISEMLGIQGVQAPTANQFVNPYAGQQGAQYALSNYQNQLGYNQLNQGSNPWMGALSGAISGGTTGAAFGPYGAVIGAGVGAVGGGLSSYYSDAKAKTEVSRAGAETKDGIPIVFFKYFGMKKRLRGVIAQDVQRKRPDAVYKHGQLLVVDYDKLGIRMEVA